jgi:hypothetical protein
MAMPSAAISAADDNWRIILRPIAIITIIIGVIRAAGIIAAIRPAGIPARPHHTAGEPDQHSAPNQRPGNRFRV